MQLDLGSSSMSGLQAVLLHVLLPILHFHSQKSSWLASVTVGSAARGNHYCRCNLCLLTKHKGCLLWVADKQLTYLYHRPGFEHMRPSMHRCQHFVKGDKAWLCTICSALSACRIGIGNRMGVMLEQGSLRAYRSSPEVVKVCIKPDILVLADLQQLCCCCLRRSICRFCG